MKKRLLSLFLAFVTLLGILPTAALAANTEEEALGEVDIYNGGYELSYLTINGRIRTQDYTYFNYVDAKGQKKEVPAYCVNPNIKGVPQTVGVGESIKYLANERSSDPKVVGIISNGYPHRSLGELKLDNKYQAYYATKMALWCYLLPNWNIANLKVAPGLTGSELDIGNRILAAAKDIYKRGTTYNYMLEPRMTATPDKSAAYSVTVDGKQYKQQVFTIWSETWVYDYDIAVSFADPGSVPQGTRIVDENDQDIIMSNGLCLTQNILEFPNQGNGCSLSAILIPDAPEKYFLSLEQMEKLLYKSLEGRRDTGSTTRKE